MIDPRHPSRGIRVGDLALATCSFKRSGGNWFALPPEIVIVVRKIKPRAFHHRSFIVESLETSARRKQQEHQLCVRSRDGWGHAKFVGAFNARIVQGHTRRWLFDKKTGEALRVATLYDEWVVSTMVPTRFPFVKEADVFAKYPRIRDVVEQIHARFSLVDGWDFVAQRRNRERILASAVPTCG